jgi:hypothetical protein
MDWFDAWEPVAYIEIEPFDPAFDSGRVTAWLILAVIALTVGVICYRHRNVRRAFWCATVGRDVEVRFRHGCVLSCSAFEDRMAIACARRCLDRSFRVQWPPAIPVLTRPGATAHVEP